MAAEGALDVPTRGTPAAQVFGFFDLHRGLCYAHYYDIPRPATNDETWEREYNSPNPTALLSHLKMYYYAQEDAV